MDADCRGCKKDLEWRKEVLKKDGYKCQKCGTKNKLVSHHIVPWNKSKKLRFALENGQTLCRSCHMTLHGTGSKKNKGQTPWNKGIKTGKGGPPRGSKFTEEHKDKLSKAKLKNKKAIARCKMLAKARKGKPLSKEHRAKLSERTRQYWARKKTED